MPGQLPIKYERVDRELVHQIFTGHIQKNTPILARVLDGPVDRVYDFELLCCGSHRCGWREGTELESALPGLLQEAGVDLQRVKIARASCFGACSAATEKTCSHILVKPQKTLYRVCSSDDLREIIREHIQGGRVVERLRVGGKTIGRKFFEIYGDVAFSTGRRAWPCGTTGWWTRRASPNTSTTAVFSARSGSRPRGFRLGHRPGHGVETAGPGAAASRPGRNGDGRSRQRKDPLSSATPTKGTPRLHGPEHARIGPLQRRRGMILGGSRSAPIAGSFTSAPNTLAIERIQNAIGECRKQGLLGKTSSARDSTSTWRSASARRSFAAKRPP